MWICKHILSATATSNIVILASAAILNCAEPAAASQIGTPGSYSVTVKSPIHYASPTSDTLIECKPSATKGHFAGPLPAVLLIHGGAWSGGNNAVNAASSYSGRWCSLWASWGYDAFSVGYRLTKEKPWPAQIVDVQAAIRWVRANAARLNVNPGMIVVNGDSAGGQLGMIAGYSYSNIPGDLAGSNAAMNPQPQLVISQFGPWTFGPSRPSGAPSVRAEDYAAQILQDHADGRTKATTPKTMFVQGTLDKTVNQCSQSEPAYRFLTGNGHPAAYLAYDGGHEFTEMNYSTFATVVGEIQVRTIAFAYARAHLAGILPNSETGPAVSYADATTPKGCP